MATRDPQSSGPFAAALQRLLRRPRPGEVDPTDEATDEATDVDAARNLIATLPALEPPEGPGEPFGHYRLLEQLPARPARERFLASVAGPSGPRRCVVERLADGTSEAELARFLASAQLAVSLHHDAIVHTFDVGRVGERYYNARDHVPGTTLDVLLARLAAARTPLPLGVALHILERVHAALEHAHARLDPTTHESLRVVHAALDERGVVLGLDGAVLLADFDDASWSLRGEVRWTPRAGLPDDEATPALDVRLLGALAARLFGVAAPSPRPEVRAPFEAALAPRPRDRPPLSALQPASPVDGRARLAALVRTRGT